MKRLPSLLPGISSQALTGFTLGNAIALLTVLVGTVIVAIADTYPKRKSGLWDLTVAMKGMPQTNMKQCVDETTDNAIDQLSNEARKVCEKYSLEQKGTGYSVNTVCNIGGSKVTTAGEITGDFSKAYTINTRSTYQPALMGLSESTTTMTGKYLGPCGPGHKPGDMILPSGQIINPNRGPANSRAVFPR